LGPYAGECFVDNINLIISKNEYIVPHWHNILNITILFSIFRLFYITLVADISHFGNVLYWVNNAGERFVYNINLLLVKMSWTMDINNSLDFVNQYNIVNQYNQFNCVYDFFGSILLK